MQSQYMDGFPGKCSRPCKQQDTLSTSVLLAFPAVAVIPKFHWHECFQTLNLRNWTEPWRLFDSWTIFWFQHWETVLQPNTNTVSLRFCSPAAFSFRLSLGSSARDRKDEGIFSEESIVNCIPFLFARMILLRLLANIADQRHQIVNCHMDLAA